jgi:hypothetical protein
MERIEQIIDQIGLEGPALERQKNILAAAKQFLAKVIEQEQITTEELFGFTRRMTPMIKANIAGAAKAQLDGMHRQVMAWKKEIPADEWKKLRVAVKGAVLARDGNLAVQYFERLLRVEGEGMRLVYMESYYPPTPMLTLLATRAVDRAIAIAIFGDPDRMFRDVLADAAAAYVEKIDFE